MPETTRAEDMRKIVLDAIRELRRASAREVVYHLRETKDEDNMPHEDEVITALHALTNAGVLAVSMDDMGHDIYCVAE